MSGSLTFNVAVPSNKPYWMDSCAGKKLYAFYFNSADFFQNQLFQKILSGIP